MGGKIASLSDLEGGMVTWKGTSHYPSSRSPVGVKVVKTRIGANYHELLPCITALLIEKSRALRKHTEGKLPSTMVGINDNYFEMSQSKSRVLILHALLTLQNESVTSNGGITQRVVIIDLQHQFWSQPIKAIPF